MEFPFKKQNLQKRNSCRNNESFQLHVDTPFIFYVIWGFAYTNAKFEAKIVTKLASNFSVCFTLGQVTYIIF